MLTTHKLKHFKSSIILVLVLLLSTMFQAQENTKNDMDSLVLKENSFGNLNLKKGMTLNESILKKAFCGTEIIKEVAQQDGPDYFLYLLKNNVMLSSSDSENELLLDLYINEGSAIADQYGVKAGMTYEELKKKRDNLVISTEHYHIYLSKEGSHITYEMEIIDYEGPDKDEYTLEELKNAKVTSIIWK